MFKCMVAGLFALIGLSACSSIIEGTSQQISVVTNPAGASCRFDRNGETIGVVNPTPGGLVVKKTKHDIDVICTKDGYEEARFHNKSGIQEATFGNIVLGGGIGWAIDSASGADNKYEPAVNMTLNPTPGGTPTENGKPDATASAPEDRLKKLQELKEKGLVSQDEYDQKRKQILAGL
jgi:hypothetical protein